MKLDDTVLGAVLLVFAGVVIGHARSFPTLAGMTVGPDLFPTIIGGGLGLCGLVLMAGGLLRRRRTGGGPWVVLDRWVTTPALAGNVLSVLAALAFYIVLSKPLGFHLTTLLILAGLMLKLGVRPVPAAAFAIVLPPLIHYVFYDLLRVPLPWGVLLPIAW
ncbi:MAG: tripartite tricarboxylate transporter TctB family protein [Inquilinus sp.]|nr:tripartite tricarboxylate transporter TctB family protein [Inquilinus sp.]